MPCRKRAREYTDDSSIQKKPIQLYYWAWRWTLGPKKPITLDDGVKAVIEHLSEIAKTFIFQLELGGKTKQYHLQGYVQTKERYRPKQLAKLANEWCPGAYWAPASNNGKAALKKYSMKTEDSTYVAGPWADHPIVKPEKLPTILLPVQTQIVKVILDPIAPRKITIFRDIFGGAGKTMVMKILTRKYPKSVFGFQVGRMEDMMEIVVKHKYMSAYIVNCPKNVAANTKAADLMTLCEQLSDGECSKTKGLVEEWTQPPANVYIFCNEFTMFDRLSADRFVCYDIYGDKVWRCHPKTWKAFTEDDWIDEVDREITFNEKLESQGKVYDFPLNFR